MFTLSRAYNLPQVQKISRMKQAQKKRQKQKMIQCIIDSPITQLIKFQQNMKQEIQDQDFIKQVTDLAKSVRQSKPQYISLKRERLTKIQQEIMYYKRQKIAFFLIILSFFAATLSSTPIYLQTGQSITVMELKQTAIADHVDPNEYSIKQIRTKQKVYQFNWQGFIKTGIGCLILGIIVYGYLRRIQKQTAKLKTQENSIMAMFETDQDK